MLLKNTLLKSQQESDSLMQDLNNNIEQLSMEKSISLLAHAISSISECVSITDMNDRVIYVNKAFLKTYKFEGNELIGNSISIVRSPNNSAASTEVILPATLQGGWKGPRAWSIAGCWYGRWASSWTGETRSITSDGPIDKTECSKRRVKSYWPVSCGPKAASAEAEARFMACLCSAVEKAVTS